MILKKYKHRKSQLFKDCRCLYFFKIMSVTRRLIRPIYIPINVHRPTGRIAMGPMEVHETVLFVAHLVGSGSASILFENLLKPYSNIIIFIKNIFAGPFPGLPPLPGPFLGLSPFPGQHKTD
jgi:hypothetical protein